MYVAKLGDMYFKSCNQNTFLNEIHKIEFTDTLNNAKVFGRYNFCHDSNDLLFERLKDTEPFFEFILIFLCLSISGKK